MGLFILCFFVPVRIFIFILLSHSGNTRKEEGRKKHEKWEKSIGAVSLDLCTPIYIVLIALGSVCLGTQDNHFANWFKSSII